MNISKNLELSTFHSKVLRQVAPLLFCMISLWWSSPRHSWQTNGPTWTIGQLINEEKKFMPSSSAKTCFVCMRTNDLKCSLPTNSPPSQFQRHQAERSIVSTCNLQSCLSPLANLVGTCELISCCKQACLISEHYKIEPEIIRMPSSNVSYCSNASAQTCLWSA